MRVPTFVETEAWLSNHGASFATLLVLVLTNVVVCWWGVWEFTSPHWITKSNVLRYTLPIARGAGRLISFNAAVILVTGSKTLWTLLRKTPLQLMFPIDDVMPKFHRLLALTAIVMGCIVHTIPQIVNYATQALKLGPGVWTYGNGVAGTQLLVTGILLVVVFAVFFVTTLEKIRRTTIGFRLFWICHIVGIVMAFPLLIIHGTMRGHPMTVYFVGVPLGIYVVDVVARRIIFKTKLSGVVSAQAFDDHGEKVTKLVLRREQGEYEFKPGQYAELLIPELARFEWHPFTIASPPSDEGTITFYIKASGRWTTALYELAEKEKLGDADDGRPLKARMRGPFGAPAESFSGYPHVLLVGTGIGVTPLLSIWLSLANDSWKGLVENYDAEDVKIKEAKKHAIEMTPSKYSAPPIEMNEMLKTANMLFTDILSLKQGGVSLVDHRHGAQQRAAILSAWLESLTCNVALFTCTTVLEALVLSLWIGEQWRPTQITQIVATWFVMPVFGLKIALSLVAYGMRYLVSFIFVLEVLIFSGAVASFVLTLDVLINNNDSSTIWYLLTFGVYLVLHVIRIMLIFYATARPASEVTRAREKAKSESLLTAHDSVRAIWVNKSVSGMSWVMNRLAESAGQVPPHYALELYATRSSDDEVMSSSPFRASADESGVTQHELKAGRPRWHEILTAAIDRAHASSPHDGALVGVFYCGMPAVARELQNIAKLVTIQHEHKLAASARPSKCNCRIVVHKENF
uniref:FAD-binding FR-type domain-containing protein n=1 Tax=Erythrolobus australicus TaxID=1077150 RepID=A0A7S1XIV4_9RHOD